MKRVFAVAEINEDVARDNNSGSLGSYFENEFGWLNESGIYLDKWIMPEKNDSEYEGYMKYLLEWVFRHCGKCGNKSPMGFNDWCKALNETRYDVLEILGKRVLFTNLRMSPEEVPEGLFKYSLRHDDECQGNITELKDWVMVNHWGDILSDSPFDPRDTSQGILISGDDYNYTGEDMTIKEYMDGKQ